MITLTDEKAGKAQSLLRLYNITQKYIDSIKDQPDILVSTYNTLFIDCQFSVSVALAVDALTKTKNEILQKLAEMGIVPGE